MKLRDVKSGVPLEARIETVKAKDLEWLKTSDQFSFDWSTEKDHELFKITLFRSQKDILGVVSLIDRPEEFRIHLNLLEVSKSNQGKGKDIDSITGSLIAFAAENAFKRGYFGFVSLVPKTVLIQHYCSTYGFQQYGRYLGIEGTAAQSLIEKYLEDE